MFLNNATDTHIIIELLQPVHHQVGLFVLRAIRVYEFLSEMLAVSIN